MQRFDNLSVEKKADGVVEVLLRGGEYQPDDKRVLKRYPALPGGLEGWVVKGLKLNCACLAGKMYLVKWVEELLLRSGTYYYLSIYIRRRYMCTWGKRTKLI